MNTAAIQLGISKGQLTELPGRRIVVTRDGMWQVDIPMSCAVADMVNLMPAPYSACPDFTFCGLDEVSNICEEGDMVSMVLTYKGLPSATSAPVYELTMSSQTEPLESHSMFATVTHDEMTQINNYVEGATTTAPSKLSDAANMLLNRKMRGTTEYLAITHIWKQTLISNTPLGQPDLQSTGFIDAPPGSPPYPSGCNWLFSGASQLREGGVYRISREWRLSAPGGWDADIYRAGSTVDDGSDDTDTGLDTGSLTTGSL